MRDSTSKERGRWREVAVLATGLAAAAALVLAGLSVHEGLAAAGEAAAARLAGTVAETVVLEWEQMLRASEPPVAQSRALFVWRSDEAELAPYPEPPASETRSVLATLLDEAERLELVLHDDAGALALVLEGLAKEPEAERRAEATLRALQLALRLDQRDVERAQATRLAAFGLEESCDGLPCRLLAALVLPPELAREVFPEPLATPAELERLFLDEDRLHLDGAGARFEPAPILSELCARVDLPLPPSARRAAHALLRLTGKRLEVPEEGRWQAETWLGRPFLLRRDGARVTGFFPAPLELARALAARASLPEGFQLDLGGEQHELGAAVHPRTSLPGAELAFTLRHVDPARLGRAEAANRQLLRAGLFALALGCAIGGALTARVLARERRLAALRSAFIAEVSHDLRTPLAAILLLCENLEAGVADGAARARYHRALRREATRLRRLIDDVLDFARLERRQAPRLEREETELEPFLSALCAELRERVEAAGRAFEGPSGSLPELASLDTQATRRALENLVDNALEHGSGTVRLGCEPRAGGLVFTVSDEGTGVPESERERVFEPFERSVRSGRKGGTGLGLAIVRAIARAHGGEARVRPSATGAAGAGATFELVLAPEVHG